MQNEYEIQDDHLQDRIHSATMQTLEELGLSDRVRVSSVQPQPDSDRFTVHLTEQTGPKESAYHLFKVEPIEALEAVHVGAITVASLKPFIRRDVLKLFPNQAIQI